MKILGIIASSILKKITDTFTRTTSGSLGNTDTGQPWVATRGTWYANGSAAQSDDAASTSTPSIASVAFGKTDVTVSASVSGGTGPVFWLTDSGSWWSAVSYNTSTSGTRDCGYCSTCTVCRSCSGGTYPSCACGSTPPSGYYTCANGTSPCFGNSVCYSNAGCTGTIVGNPTFHQTSPGTCNYCNSDCTACGRDEVGGGTYPSCTCGTPQCAYTDYFYYLRLLKSVSGTVSTATSDVSLASQAAAIVVQTAAGAITAKAYSDTTMTTQLGTTINLTPVSPTQGTSVGIVKYTSPYNQGSTVDDFSAQ